MKLQREYQSDCSSQQEQENDDNNNNENESEYEEGSSEDDETLEDGDESTYDFGRHGAMKEELDKWLQREGRFALEHCDRLGTQYVGLVNQGATCYLNSLLQSLFFVKGFREKIYNWKGKAKVTEDKNIPIQLQRLFMRLQFAEQPAVSTKDLTTSFGWSDMDAFEQQDVQELCRILFDSLEQYGEEGKNLTNSFKGSLVDYLICLNCKHRRAKREEFQDISLVLHGSNLQDALNNFVEVERLDGDNQYFCEHCNQKVDAIKGHRLASLPPVLVLHLKRFTMNWETERRIKVQETMQIPMSVDVGNLVGLDEIDEPTLNTGPDPTIEDSFSDSLQLELQIQQTNVNYRLDAILIHSGNANSGHYYAIVRTGPDTWHEFNDIQVTKLTEKQVVKMCSKGGFLAEGGAYMMMYSQLEDGTNRHQYADQVKVPTALMNWIQAENEKRSSLRKALRMEKLLVSLKVILDPRIGDREILLEKNGQKATLVDLKHEAYIKLVPREQQSQIPLSKCKLHWIDETRKRFLAPAFQENDHRSLGKIAEEMLGPRQRTLLLEFDPQTGTEEFQVQFLVCGWDSAVRGVKYCRADFSALCEQFSFRTCVPPVCLSAPNATVRELKDRLPAKAGDVLLLREGKDASILNDDDVTIESLELSSGDSIVVSRDRTGEDVLREYNEAKDFITILFNHPLTTVRNIPAKYDRTIKMAKDSDLASLKRHIFESLGIELDELDNYHLRKSAKASQLKDMTKSLSEAGFTDQSVVHIGKGKPIPVGFVMLRVYEASSETGEQEDFRLLFRLHVEEGASMKQLRKQIAERMQVDDPERVRLVDKTPQNQLGQIFRDGKSIKATIKRLQDGRPIVVKILEQKENLNHLLLAKVAIVEHVVEEEEIEYLRIVEEREQAMSKSWTIAELEKEICPGFCSMAHVPAATLKKASWKNDASLLEWINLVEPAEHIVSKEISKFPLRADDGSMFLCCQSTNLAAEEFPSLPISSDKESARKNEIKKKKDNGRPRNNKPWSNRSEKTSGVKIAAAVLTQQPQPMEVRSPEPPTAEMAIGGGINSESTDPSEFKLSNWMEPSSSTTSMKGNELGLNRIPSLDLSEIPTDRKTYQEEFMENKDDFSESWREAAKEIPTHDDYQSKIKEEEEEEEEEVEVEEHKEEDVFYQKYKAGDRVLAKAEHWKRWFPGTVFSFSQEKQAYSIDFDDGDRLEDVPDERMRAFQVDQTKKKERVPSAKSSVGSSSSRKQLEPLSNPSTGRESNPGGATPPTTTTYIGLDGSEDLCPTDKKARRKEKLASRDLRLQLMFMDDDHSGSVHEPEEHRRAISASNLTRPSLEPLQPVSRATTMPGRMRMSPKKKSRIPKLNPLATTADNKERNNKVTPGSTKTYIPSPQNKSFHHAARKLSHHSNHDQRSEDNNNNNNHASAKEFNKKLKPLPPIKSLK